MHLDDILQVIIAVCAVGGVTGVIGASFRVGRNTQAVNSYREIAQALEAKDKLRVTEISELRQNSAVKDAEISELNKEISHLRDRLATMERMVTGRDLIEQMSVAIASKQAEILGQIGNLRGEVVKMHMIVKQLAPAGGA